MSEPRRTEYEAFTLRTLTPHLGAEVDGLDLAQTLDPAALKELKAAWHDWMVLVFRDQRLTREQHKSFARHFGRLHVHPMHGRRDRKGDDDPEVLRVVTKKDSAYTAGEGWHTDVTCDAIPPLGSLLYVTKTPASGGGDTLYADMVLAYELLSDPVKAFLEGLEAVHDGALPYVGAYKSTPPPGGYPRNAHPVVTRHPETGRKILYVNSGFTSHIRGLAPRESRRILDLLFEHIATTPKLWARVSWRPNTLTMWDNRCTQHHAVWDYWPHSRYGERISVVGDEPPAR